MSHRQTWNNFPMKFWCAELRRPYGKISWYTHNTSAAWKEWVRRAKNDPDIKLWVWNVGEVDRAEYIPE